MENIASFFIYPFMQNALIASLLAAIACGIVGTLVVCNRLTFLAGGASHAAYGGIGLALYYQLPLLPCTIGFSLLASLLMGGVSLRQEQQNGFKDAAPDAAIGVLWAAGMAFGIILIQLTPGYAGELMGFLFGSILAVPTTDILAMAAFDLVLLAVLAFFHQGLWATSLDKEFARARGLPVNLLFLLIVALTAVAVVLLIRVVGLILVLALLTIPPFLARRICSSFYSTMAMASLFALAFCLCGLAVSWQTDISSGAAIVAVATLCYFIASLPALRLRKLAPGIALALCLAFMVTPADAAPKKTSQAAQRCAPAKASASGKASGKASSSKGKALSPQKGKNEKSLSAKGRSGKKGSGKKNARGKRFSYPPTALPGYSDTVSAEEQMEARTAAALATPANASFSPSSASQVNLDFTTSSLKKSVSSCVAAPEYDDDCSLAEKGISSGFGYRRGRFHKGVDMPAPDGSPIHAMDNGIVQFSGRDKAYGICLLIERSDGLVVRYAHMQNTSLQAGDTVKAGQLVGAVGRTGRAYGSHLHLEIMDKGKLLNPAPYIRSGYDIVPDSGKRSSGTQFASRGGVQRTFYEKGRPSKGKNIVATGKNKRNTRKKGGSSLVLARSPVQ